MLARVSCGGEESLNKYRVMDGRGRADRRSTHLDSFQSGHSCDVRDPSYEEEALLSVFVGRSAVARMPRVSALSCLVEQKIARVSKSQGPLREDQNTSAR